MKKCDVYRNEFDDSLVRECPHPGVIKGFGKNGKANVCVYVCKKCQFGVQASMMCAFKCAYKGE